MDLYANLMKQGWTLPEIDGMDILFYFRLIKHMSKEKTVPADSVSWL